MLDKILTLNMKTGVREVPIQMLVELATIYDTSVDFILGLTDEEIPYPQKRNSVDFLTNLTY